MKRQSKSSITSAGALVAACAALAIGYPMLARQDAQPTPPVPAPAPAPAPSPAPAQPGATPPAPAPAPAPATTPGQPEKPADPPGAEKPADKPGDKPADKPADAGATTPAPGADAAKPKDTTPAKPKELPKRSANGRVIQPDDTTVLAFKNVTVDQVLPFIVEATGKVVVPRPDLLPRKITVINDQPIKRSQALNLLFYALQQEGVGVIETQDIINLRNIAEIVVSDVPVIGGDERLAGREDVGVIVLKVYSPKFASARNIVEGFEEAKTMPDFAKIFLDPESNQFSIMGHIGLLQRVEAELDALDRQSSESTHTRTFRLKYADAEKIATNIKDLFSAGTGQNQNNQNNQNQFRGWGGNDQNQNRGRRRNTDDNAATTSANLRVTPNTQQNSVTVLAELNVLDQIEDAITEEWDLPLEEGTVIPKVVQIVNTDAVKMKASLEEIFGKGGAGTSTTPTQGGGGGGQRGNQGGGGDSSSGTSQGASRLAGQFAFTALTDSNRLVVIAKSPDNMTFVEKLIKDLDQPKNTGLPKIIELKHASAEELAEQLNAMLAQEGTLASIQRQASGLTNEDSNASPFSTATTDTATNAATTATNTAANAIQFWWQRARPPTDNAGASNIVSKVRIVPVWRQNALMIMSPPEYTAALLDLVSQLDKPGRQVLISAIVVEISLDDSTALGLRWSSANLTSTNPDNIISIGNSVTGTKNNLIDSLFDTSVLQTNANLNLILQALALKTTTNILSEPRIFTSDNQEAKFFDGQDIPFVNELQTNNTGDPTQSFDYRAVGIQLTVRPRITIKRDVDLNINLELSSVAPGQTSANAFIVDRRETTTHLIVKDGQTVVLSGIMRNETSNINRKIPLLGDLPLIGALFTSVETRKVNTELIAFITPIVVENTDDADKLYEKDRNRLEDMRKKDFGAEEAPPLPESLKEINEVGGEKEAPTILPDAGSENQQPNDHNDGPKSDPAGSAATSGTPAPLSYSDIVTMDAETASRESSRRRIAATAPGVSPATKQRLLDESDKCRERVTIAQQQANAHVPAPISDEIISVLDVEGAMKEWKARSAASKRDGLDPAVKLRLSTEAEKCRLRMIAASS